MCEECGQSEGRTNPAGIRPFSGPIPIAVLTADPLSHLVKVDQLASLLKIASFSDANLYT